MTNNNCSPAPATTRPAFVRWVVSVWNPKKRCYGCTTYCRNEAHALRLREILIKSAKLPTDSVHIRKVTVELIAGVKEDTDDAD